MIYFPRSLFSTLPASTTRHRSCRGCSEPLPQCSIPHLVGALTLATSWPSTNPPLPHLSVVPFTQRLSPSSVPFFQQPSLPSIPHHSFLSMSLPPPAPLFIPIPQSPPSASSTHPFPTPPHTLSSLAHSAPPSPSPLSSYSFPSDPRAITESGVNQRGGVDYGGHQAAVIER